VSHVIILHKAPRGAMFIYCNDNYYLKNTIHEDGPFIALVKVNCMTLKLGVWRQWHQLNRKKAK